MTQSHTHHTINYIEIYATDIGASRRFYEAAFDWKFTEYAPTYLGIQKPGGGEVGGLCAVDEVHKGSMLVILFSNDLKASLASVREAGGTIVKEPFPFPGGSRFQFLDPAGNELAVWSEENGLD